MAMVALGSHNFKESFGHHNIGQRKREPLSDGANNSAARGILWFPKKVEIHKIFDSQERQKSWVNKLRAAPIKCPAL